MPLHPDIDPERMLSRMFSSKKVAGGGVFHRAVRDVERLVGRDRFLREVEKRGFQCLENNGQFLVLCNRAPVHRLR